MKCIYCDKEITDDNYWFVDLGNGTIGRLHNKCKPKWKKQLEENKNIKIGE